MCRTPPKNTRSEICQLLDRDFGDGGNIVNKRWTHTLRLIQKSVQLEHPVKLIRVFENPLLAAFVESPFATLAKEIVRNFSTGPQCGCPAHDDGWFAVESPYSAVCRSREVVAALEFYFR